MAAQNKYLSSIFLSLSTFLESTVANAHEREEAHAVFSEFVLQKATLSNWTVSELHRFLDTSAPHQTVSRGVRDALIQFVQKYPPHQTNVFLHEYLLALKSEDCSDSTIKNYRSDINQFFGFVNETEVEKVFTKPKTELFIAAQAQKGLKESSIRRKLVSIVQFALWLQAEKIIASAAPLQSLSDNLEELIEKAPQKNVTISEPTTHFSSVPTSSVPAFATARHLINRRQGALTKQDLRSRIKNNWSALQSKLTSRENRPALPYLNLAIIILFAVTLGFFGYRQFIADADAPLAYPTSPTRPNRVLQFQGRLTDTSQNPIVTATDMAFRLYDANTAGTLLWNSGTCSITPDQDGIFNADLGSVCGTEISENVFTENSNVWLEVQIESETLEPRQSIKTVPYALNSETLQGYPIDATGAATKNTVVTMNNTGEVIFGEVSPILRAVSGNFVIEAETLTLRTSAGSDGDIVLAPDGTGITQVQSDLDALGYISAPGATLSATYAGGTALIARGGPSGTANIQTWQNSSGTVLSSVNAAGNIGIGTSTPTALLELYSDASQYIKMNHVTHGQETRILFQQAGTTEASIGTGTGNSDNALMYRAGASQYFYVSDTELALSLTAGGNGPNTVHVGTASPTTPASFSVVGFTGSADRALIRFEHESTPTLDYLQIASNGSATGDIFAINSNGNVGIGSTTPAYDLDLVGEFNLTDAIRVAGDAGTSGYLLTSSGGGAMTWTDPGSIGGATTWWDNTQNVFHPMDEYAAVVDLAIGGTSTASANIHLLSNGAAVFNQQGNAVDFRIESDSNTHAFFLQGSDGNIGIGSSTPGYALDLVGEFNLTDAIRVAGNAGTSGYLLTSTGGSANTWTNPEDVGLWTNTDNVFHPKNPYASVVNLTLGGTSTASANIHLLSNGAAVFNQQGNAVNFRVESDTDENALFVNGTTNNVGIGTNTPTVKLHVIGDIVGSTSVGTDITGSFRFGGTEALTSSGVNGSVILATHSSWTGVDLRTGGTTRLFINADGNVGIGSTSPIGMLNVDGAAIGKALVILNETGNQDIIAASASGVSRFRVANNGYAYADRFVDISNSTYYIDPAAITTSALLNGNVGIGTSTANYQLDLVGEFNLTDALRVAGDAGTSGWLFTSSGGGANVWVDPATITDAGLWAETDNLFHPKSPYTSVVDLALGGDTTASATIHFRSDGQAYFANNVGIGTNTPLGLLNVSGAAVGKALAILNETGNQNIFTASASGTTRFVIQNDGNVGIGTTTPGATLSVNSSGSTDIFNALDGGTEVFTIIDGGNVGIGTTSPVANAHIYQASPTANQILFQIGTDASANRFTVDEDGDGHFGGDVDMRNAYVGNGTFTAPSFSFINDPNTGIYRPGIDTLGFVTGAVENMTLNADGNVGIGSTTPTYELDLVGEFNLTDAIRIAGDAGTNGFLLTSSGGGANTWTDPADLTDAGYWDITDNTLHPKNPYTSVVDVTIGGNSTASATTHFFSDGGAVFNQQGVDTDFRIEASGQANAFFVQGSDGNVGIGTNLPGQKLDVVGEVALSNYLYFDNGTAEYLRWDSSDFILSDDLLAASDGGSNLGSSTTRWNSLYVKGTAGIRIGNDGNEGIISYNTASDYLGFDPDGNGSSNVVILDNGNVGIGTTGPAGSLHVQTGQALFPLGASTPGVSFVTNIDTGLAADLNFLYFHNNGNIPAGVKNDSIVVTSTSHVGWTAGTSVGNTTDVKLFRDASNTLALRNATAAQEFRIYNTDDTADEFVSLGFSNTSNVFTLQTEESGGGTIRDIALLGGNVGIGTTVPVGLLHVEGAEVGKALVALNETGNQAILVASASGTNRFIIQNNGNVGIGTISPGARLSIGAGTSGTSAIHLASNSTNSNILSVGYATSIDFGYGPGTGLAAGDISLIGGTVGTSRSVGVSLNYTGASFKVVQNAASATTPLAYFTGGATPVGDYFQIRSSAASTGDIFAINNVGNVGIGSDTPAYKLDVVGEFNLTDAIRVAGDAGTSGYILTSTGGSANTWVNPETINVSGYWELGSNVLYPKNPYAGVVDLAIGGDSTASANILLRNDGLAYFAGNVGIGSSSPTAKLDVTGSVNFNATTMTFDDTNLSAPITLTDTDTGFDSSDTGIVDAINTAYNAAIGSTGSGGMWTDTTPGAGSGIIYPSSGTDNFAVGGTSLVAAFSVNESANAIRLGDGAGSNVTLSMYASDGDTGLITYNTSDQWDFTGGDLDLNQNVAIGAGAGEPSTSQTLTLGTNYALNSTTYQLYSASTITSPTLTADAISYGNYFSLTNNKTEDTGAGFDSDAYASYSLVSTTGTNTFRNNFGAYAESRNSSTAASNLGTLYGSYSVAQQSATSGTIPAAYGATGLVQGAGSASTSTITLGYGLFGQVNTYNTDIGTSVGALNSSTTSYGYDGAITAGYGSYNQVYADSDTAAITTGTAGYFTTGKRATASNMTTAYGINVDANAGTTTYGAYIVADDTAPSNNYGVFINALNASAENFGIWGDNGDWILDADGNGVAGGTGAGGDLYLGESQDFALYHDGTNSYISNATGDLYIQSGTNDLILANSGGNVGIGSTAPAEALDIVGNLQFSGALMPNGAAGTSGYVLQSTGAGTAPTWVDVSLISGNLWANTQNVFHPINQYAGVVDLVIGGNSTASADIQLLSNGSAVFNEQGNDSDFRVEASGVANALFVQGSDGNVGIGTNLPSQKLDVTGEIELANYLYFGNGTSEYLRWNSSDFVLSDDLLAASDGGSNLGASATRWNTLFVKGSGGIQLGDNGNTAIIGYSTGSNYLTFDANGDATSEMIIADGGNVGIGTTTTLAALQVHRAAASQLFITTNTDIGSSNDASLFFQSDNDGTPNPAGIGQFNDGSLRLTGGGSLVTPDMVITDAGNVGIGTTAASQLLDVDGEIELANYLYFGNGTSEYLRWDTSNFILSDDLLPVADGGSNLGSSTFRWESLYVKGSSLHIGDDGDDAIIGYNTTDDYLSFDANGDATSEMILTDAGNLGIGTTTAANFLVEADGNVGPSVDNTYDLGSPSIRWANIYATEIIASGLWDADVDTGVQVEESADEDKIRFDTAGTEKMIIDTTGNVGIGSTAPIGRLNVTGAAVGKALVILDETGNQDLFTASASGITRFTITSAGYALADRFADISNTAYFIDPAAITTSGTFASNVGIGTSNPSTARLVVRNSSTEDIFNAFDDATEVMTIIDGGNVGIGTTNPAQKLHIEGAGADMRLTTTSTAISQMEIFENTTERFSIGYSPTDNEAFLWNESSSKRMIALEDDGDLVLQPVSGNVGVGTSSPDSLFHVAGANRDSTPNSAGFRVGEDGSGNYAMELTSNAGIPHFDFQNDTAGTDYDARIGLYGDDYLAILGANVGIGTTAPTFDLEVGATDTSDPALLALNGGSAIGAGEVAGLRLEKGGTTFGRWSLDASGTMQFQVENAAGGGANLDFNTGASNNTIRFWPKGTMALELNDTTAVFPSGINVGIGSTAPDSILDIIDTSAAAGGIYTTIQNTTATGWSGLVFHDEGNTQVSRIHHFNSSWSTSGAWETDALAIANNIEGINLVADGASGDIEFFTGGQNQRMKITNTGNVGINSTTPGATLNVNGTIMAGTSTSITAAVTPATGDIIAGDASGGFQFDASANDLYAQQSTANATGVHFNVRKSRGTAASPTVLTTGDDIFLLRAYGRSASSTWSEAGRITFDTEGTVTGTTVPGILRFYTQSTAGSLTERMVIDSDGNIGIGSTSPGQKLVVNGNLQIGAAGYIDDDATMGENSDDWIHLNGYLEMKSNTSSYGIVLRDDNTTDYFGITQNGGYSMLTDTNTSPNYFLRGNGADVDIRGQLETGQNVLGATNGYHSITVGPSYTGYSSGVNIRGGNSSPDGVNAAGVSLTDTRNTSSAADDRTWQMVNRYGQSSAFEMFYTPDNWSSWKRAVRIETNGTFSMWGSDNAQLRYNQTNQASNYLEFYSSDEGGNIGVNFFNSSLKMKKNVESLIVDSEKLYDLEIVSYHYKTDSESQRKSLGLIAEWVNEQIPEIVAYESDGVTPHHIMYGEMSVLILDQLQKIKPIIDTTQLKTATLGFNPDGYAISYSPTQNQYNVTQSNTSTPITITAAFAQAIIAEIKAGLVRTQDLVVEKTASIANLNVNSLTIQGMSLTNYITSVVNGQINSGNIALISPVGNDTVIRTATISGEIAFNNSQGETVAAITEDGDFSAEGTSSLGALLVNTNASISGTLAANNVVATTSKLGTLLVDGPATFSATLSANSIIANNIDVTSSRMQQLEAKIAEVERLKVAAAEIETATVSGTLYANNIDGLDNKIYTATSTQKSSLLDIITGTDSVDNIDDVIAAVDSAGMTATQSADMNLTLADLQLESSDVALNVDALFVDRYFKVNGGAYIAGSMGIGNSVFVEKTITAGESVTVASSLQIGDGFIEYSGNNTFEIQPSGTGSLSLMAGLLTLDENGTATVNGNFTVEEDATVKGTLFANLLKSTELGNPLQVQVAGISDTNEVKKSRFEIIDELGTPVATISAEGKAEFAGGVSLEGGLSVGTEDLGLASLDNVDGANRPILNSNKTSGKATIPSGSAEITIRSNKIGPNSLIYVTPVGSTNNKVLFVKSQQDENPAENRQGEFVVGFDEALGQEVHLNWWIIN